MTEQQNKYQQNLINQAHNLAMERIEQENAASNKKQANTAQYRAETDRAELVNIQPHKVAAEKISSVGTFMRGAGSLFSALMGPFGGR